MPTTETNDQWEKYWEATRTLAKSSTTEARSLWDTDPQYAVDQDLPRFEKHFDPALPVVDIGCGSGMQTERLAKHFPTVIGTDVSESAVALAAATHKASNLSYKVLDALSVEDAKRFHDEVGDVNLYVRTVVHSIGGRDRIRLGECLRILLGEKGRMYMIELGPRSPDYVERYIREHGVPDKLARVMSTGLKPGPVSRTDVDVMFPPKDYEVEEGDSASRGADVTSIRPDGSQESVNWEPPMYYAVVGKRRKSN